MNISQSEYQARKGWIKCCVGDRYCRSCYLWGEGAAFTMLLCGGFWLWHLGAWMLA